VERSEGVFEPREVETGWRFGERVEIRQGVRAGERVVVAATFLVDSESRLKTAVPPSQSRAVPGGHSGTTPLVAAAKTVKDPRCGMPLDPATAIASGNTLPYPGGTHYFCSKQCKEAYRSDPSNTANRRQGD